MLSQEDYESLVEKLSKARLPSRNMFIIGGRLIEVDENLRIVEIKEPIRLP